MKTVVQILAVTQPLIVETFDDEGKTMATYNIKPADGGQKLEFGSRGLRITHGDEPQTVEEMTDAFKGTVLQPKGGDADA